MFGAWGKPGSDEYVPFMMDVNGIIDFGAWTETRSAEINISEKAIRVQEYCTYRDNPKSPNNILRIEDVQSLE